MKTVDLLVVGSGPAGMCAAIEACSHGLRVLVVDDQSSPGGQIWRSIELSKRRDHILGSAYVEGRDVATAFRACGATYEPGAQLWQIEPGFRAYISRAGRTDIVHARTVVLATGAQERPVPFEGWTLPGVMTVGAAQILLKNAGQIPAGPLWIAGSGPLPLLYAVQFIRAGGELAGYLDTTPAGQWQAALRHFPGALRSLNDLIKGLGWQSTVRRHSGVYRTAVGSLVATGGDRLETVHYRTKSGEQITAATRTLLVHEGVVPSIHPALSLDCEVAWSEQQDCFIPKVDAFGETSRENVWVAGDGAGIAGAKAALVRGTLAGLAAAARLGRIEKKQAEQMARPLFRRLKRELAARPFLDVMFRPRTEIFAPTDQTIVCRCEEVTAGDIRAAAQRGNPGPNQVKAAVRAGMGACQGRQCGYTLMRLIAATQQRPPAAVGFLHIRPPLKPITLGELAAVDDEQGSQLAAETSIAEE